MNKKYVLIGVVVAAVLGFGVLAYFGDNLGVNQLTEWVE